MASDFTIAPARAASRHFTIRKGSYSSAIIATRSPASIMGTGVMPRRRASASFVGSRSPTIRPRNRGGTARTVIRTPRCPETLRRSGGVRGAEPCRVSNVMTSSPSTGGRRRIRRRFTVIGNVTQIIYRKIETGTITAGTHMARIGIDFEYVFSSETSIPANVGDRQKLKPIEALRSTISSPYENLKNQMTQTRLAI